MVTIDEEDRHAHVRHRTTVVARAGATVGSLLFVGLIALIVFAAVTGGDPAKAKRVALDWLWPSANHDYGPVYAALGMAAVPAAEFDTAIENGLARLEKQPCDKAALAEIAKALVAKKDGALAAQADIGFAKRCNGDEFSARAGGRILYDLGDYKGAEAIFTGLTDRFPQYDNDWYYEGLSQAALGERGAALQSYANTIALARDQAKLRERVFTEMAALYAGSGRFCEAMAPVEAYVAMRPAERDTSRTRLIVQTYSDRGHCPSSARGQDTFPILSNDVVRVRARINDVVGTFVVDTGASFVTVSDAFAAKAGLKTDAATTAASMTANGTVRVKLTKADRIRLGRVEADDVAVVTVAKPFDGIDGLLGRSFLSRFEVTMAQSRMVLHAKR